MLPIAFDFIAPYRTRDGSSISVIFACGPDVAVNAIVRLLFLTSTGSILVMNDNISDMTKVNIRPFPIDSFSPSNSAPVAPGVDDSSFPPPLLLHPHPWCLRFVAVLQQSSAPSLLTPLPIVLGYFAGGGFGGSSMRKPMSRRGHLENLCQIDSDNLGDWETGEIPQ